MADAPKGLIRCPSCLGGDLYRYTLNTKPPTAMARCVCGWEDEEILLVAEQRDK
jgi:hypothetical protein